MEAVSQAYHAYHTRRFFTALDGIRAIAILGVIWHHTVAPFEWLPMSGRGFLGVDLFFVLSGYLIVTLLLRERERHGDISLRKFYMRRTLRIFPVYYGMLIALGILFYVVAPNNEMAVGFREHLPFYATYTANWVHDVTIMSITWSLAAEEQFYLFWPPIEKFLHKWTLPIVAVFIFFNQLINFGVIFAEQHARLEILQSTFTPIALGVVLAHWLHNKERFEQLYRFVGQRWSPVVFGIGLLVAINIPVTDISGIVRLTIHLFMTLFIISCVVREDTVLHPVLKIKSLARLGVISYGMYLFHMFARHGSNVFLDRLGINVPFDLFIVTLISTIIIAELSFRFYETPFLKLKHRWATVQTRPQVNVAPAD